RNVIRRSGLTCRTCATPVAGYLRCVRCHRDRQAHGAYLSDLVVPLCYAVSNEQSGLVLRGYKDNRSETARRQHARIVTDLLAYGLLRHERCAEAVVGSPIAARVAVPSSGTSRRRTHPLITVSDWLGATSPHLRLTATSG